MTFQAVDPKQSGLFLYYAPGACSRVTITALEEARATYELRRVALGENENKSAEYKAINPKGKVPALVVDGRILTENVAIQSYLDKRFPEAGLFPKTTDDFTYAQNLSVLAWVSSGLHPLVTRIRRTARFCDLPGADKRVPELARVELAEQLQVAEERLARAPFLLGEKWSIADVYLHWVWSRSVDEHFDTKPFPRLVEFVKRMDAWPSVQRAIAKETAG